MKSQLKKIFQTQSIKNIRNIFNIRPIPIDANKITKSASVSDAFLWRTDNSFTTTFKYSNILKLLYNNENSCVKLFFYNKYNIKIKSLTINDLKFSNELIIDKHFMDGIEDYGTFYIFHKMKKIPNQKIIISNKCYLGFSFKNNINSFVHGNTYASYQGLNDELTNSDLVNTSISNNQKYFIQNYFENFDKTELFFNNPTTKKINFFVNSEAGFLNSGNSIIYNASNIKKIEIKSNCYFFRPIIFNYKNDFIDVYHA